MRRKNKSRRTPITRISAAEVLENRLVLSPNLKLVDAYLMDGAGHRAENAIIGERVGVRFDFFVEGLSAGDSYSVAVTIDGVTKTREMTHGAGSNPGNWWNGIAGWFVVDREYDVSVVLDSENDVDELNEGDNLFEFTFRPVQPTPHFKMAFPIPLEHSKEFTIGGYVDLNNELGAFNDFSGGRLAYDGHEGIDVNAQSLSQADRGIPIVAAAAGTVKFSRDGYSDFGGDGSSNKVVIDHGNGWETEYGHLRRDSVRVVEGDTVARGERIAFMGGSGNGVIHLHFEMKFNGRDVDPNVVSDAFWENPLQYSGEAKNVLMIKPTNYAFWEAHDQEASSSFSESTTFTQGEPQSPVFYGRLTGLLPEDEVFWRFYRPDGSLYASWQTGVSGPPVTWPHTFKWFTPRMPALPEIGDWKIAMEVNGVEMEARTITYTSDTFGLIRVEDASGLYLHPHRFRPMVVDSQHEYKLINHGTGPLSIHRVSVPEGFELRSDWPEEIAAGDSATILVGPDLDFVGYSTGFLEIHSSSVPSPVYRFTIETPGEADGVQALIVGTERRVFGEGEEFSANVRRTGDLSQPLTVQLETSDSGRFQIPDTVEFAAGEEWKRFDVRTIADIDMRTSERSSIRAVATGYISGQAEVELTEQPFLRFDSYVDEIEEDQTADLLIGRIYRGNSSVADPLDVSLSWDTSTGLQLPQSVTIASGDAWVDVFAFVEDNTRVDGDRSTTIHAGVDGYPSDEVTLIVLENDTAGLVVQQTGDTTALSEPAGTDSVSVSLTAEPASHVTIQVSNNLTTQATLSSDELIFTPENWSVPQQIVLAAVDDLFVEPEMTGELTFAVDSEDSDSDFGEVSPVHVPFTIADDEIAGFSVSSTDETNVVGEDATADSVSVVLDARPSENVVFDITALDESEVTVQPSALTFTPNNWNIPQDITLTGADDSTVDGAVTSTVRVSINAAASQAEFRQLNSVNLTVETIDNDVAEFRVIPTGDSTVATEGGDTDSVNIVLARQPLSEVVFSFATGDENELNVSPASLVFTPANWDQIQQVTVTAVNDDRVDGSQTVLLTATVNTEASDAAWAGLSPRSLDVIVQDNDVASLITEETNDDTTVGEDHSTDTLLVRLSAQPIGNIRVALESLDAGEVEAVESFLTFTPSNWHDQQTVTLRGVDDEEPDGDQQVVFRLAVTESADPAFNDVSGTVMVTVLDDDFDVPRITAPTGVEFVKRPAFRWTSVPDATEYDIELILLGGQANPVIQQTVTGTTLIPSEDLPIGRYRLWVRARFGSTETSDWVSAPFSRSERTTIAEVPFHATTRRPEFHWQPIEGAGSYRVYVSNLSTGANGFFDEILTATTYQPADDWTFGRYRVWVRPVAADGYQARWSFGEDYYIGAEAVSPSVESTSRRPTFTWTSVPGAVSYHLYVAGTGGVVLSESGITSTSYQPDTELPVGDFRWWVKSFAENEGSGAWSLPQEFMTGGRSRVLSPAGNVNTSIPLFEWVPVSGAVSYELYLSRTGQNPEVLRFPRITTTSFTPTPLPNGDYKAWIRTTLGDGSDVWGSSHSFQVAEAVNGATVLLLGPTTPTFESRPVFQWTASPGRSRYQLQLHNGIQSVLLSDLQSTTARPDIDFSGQWSWVVRAVDSNGSPTSWSSRATFNTEGRTQLISPSTPSSNLPFFRWYEVAGATGYALQVDNLTTGESQVIRRDDLTGSSFLSDSELTAGDYRAWVRAISTDGPGPWSLQFDFTVAMRGFVPRLQNRDQLLSFEGSQVASSQDSGPGHLATEDQTKRVEDSDRTDSQATDSLRKSHRRVIEPNSTELDEYFASSDPSIAGRSVVLWETPRSDE